MNEPPKPHWQILRLAILLVVGVGAAVSYGWVIALVLGLELSGWTLSILAVVGGALGALAWILLSVP